MNAQHHGDHDPVLADYHFANFDIVQIMTAAVRAI